MDENAIIEFFDGPAPGKDSGSLMSDGALAYVFIRNGLDVTTVVSDDRMYQVCGIRKPADH